MYQTIESNAVCYQETTTTNLPMNDPIHHHGLTVFSHTHAHAKACKTCPPEIKKSNAIRYVHEKNVNDWARDEGFCYCTRTNHFWKILLTRYIQQPLNKQKTEAHLFNKSCTHCWDTFLCVYLASHFVFVFGQWVLDLAKDMYHIVFFGQNLLVPNKCP